MASELRPVMPVDLFKAAVEGNSDVLIPRLGLQPEEPTDQIQVTIEATHSSPEQIKTELRSAAGFGDTVLHLLVTHGHNVLALKVFQRDMSLLNAQNKMLETPLHCATKVGNVEFMCKLIELDPVIVKDAIKEIDENGDTPFHVAAKHGHVHVIRKLMECDPKIAHRVNNEMLCPLHIAIMKNYTKMVKEMLEVDLTLACIPFSDGKFPVHVSACMGNIELVKHFIKEYPNYATLLDRCGRNLFHIAAEKKQTKIFKGLFKDTNMGEMIVQMNNATDNEGNTSLHIAAMEGHRSIMKAIWKKKNVGIDADKIQNNEGLTPFELSKRQQLETNKDIADYMWFADIRRRDRFTPWWFDEVMNPVPKNKWEKIQVLGLGSVLITTVSFAVAFTVPGGYNQDNGTPVLGKRYMFRAFILATTLAFIQGFVSLLVLLWEPKNFRVRLRLATMFLQLAAASLVIAFGLGIYVTLAPICYPIAVIILVITLCTGSPCGMDFIISSGPYSLIFIDSRLNTEKWADLAVAFAVLILHMVFPFIFIFCLALA